MDEEMASIYAKYYQSVYRYLLSLSNKDNYKYRLIIELVDNNVYSYASVGFGDNNE